MERRLAVILAADVVGYSTLMEKDEAGTFTRLKAGRQELVEPEIARHHGRIFKLMGDGFLAEFASVVDAVECAVALQRGLAKRNDAIPEDNRIHLRIGINLGEVIVEGDDRYGEGVNVAARLEQLADSGGILVSGKVAKEVEKKLAFKFEPMGNQTIKNLVEPVPVYRVHTDHTGKPRLVPSRQRLRPTVWAIAGLAVAALIMGAYFFSNSVAPVLKSPALPEGPSVVVLPFNNRSDDPQQDYFADGWSVPLPTGPRIALIPFKSLSEDAGDAFFSEGLTRDINAQLSRFSNLFVIAPEAGNTYRNDPDCGEIRKELMADYILTGTVQRYNERIRVTTAFLDAKSCIQLVPPGPFDRDLNVAGVLDIQLEIASRVASEIGSGNAPLFNVAIQREIRDKAPDKLTAYECVLMGYWFYQTFAAPEHRRARACLERAVLEEPDYSLAWSRLAFIYMEAKKSGIDAPPDWAERAQLAAATALEKDRDNPDAYYAKAALSRMLGQDINVFLENAKKAINLNPNDSWILADLGTWLAYAGKWEEGEMWIARAKALNPKLHPGFNNVWHLHAFAKGEYQEAITIMLAMGGQLPMNLASLAASYALKGELEKAQAVVSRMREMYPDFAEDPRAPFRSRGMPQSLIDKLMEGLEIAGYNVPPE